MARAWSKFPYRDKKFVYDIATNTVHTPRTFIAVDNAPIVGPSGTPLAHHEVDIGLR